MMSFTVFKDSAGRWRWLALSSNAYRDRDGEIVSMKALAQDIAYADRTKEYGPLRFWHMPGVDIGHCDFNMLHGKTLVEAGTFINGHIAKRVKERADKYQVSIGFKHPPSEPGRDGVFHNIRRFERSLVPAGRAANPFTRLLVKEKQMNQKQKVEALKALLDDDALVGNLLSAADTQEKQADQMGIAFKEADGQPDWGQMHPVDRLEHALKGFEAWEAAEKAKGDKPPFPPKAASEGDEDEEEEAGPPAKAEKGDYTEKMGSMLADMQKCVGDLKGYVAKMTAGSTQKDDAIASTAEAVDAHSTRIANLDAHVLELQSQLSEATKELNELKGEQPAAVAAGYRPSQAADTITAQQTAEKAHDDRQAVATNGSYDQFLDFLAPPAGGAEEPPIQPAQ